MTRMASTSRTVLPTPAVAEMTAAATTMRNRRMMAARWSWGAAAVRLADRVWGRSRVRDSGRASRW